MRRLVEGGIYKKNTPRGKKLDKLAAKQENLHLTTVRIFYGQSRRAGQREEKAEESGGQAFRSAAQSRLQADYASGNANSGADNS
jgi:hypothetical protein